MWGDGGLLNNKHCMGALCAIMDRTVRKRKGLGMTCSPGAQVGNEPGTLRGILPT